MDENTILEAARNAFNAGLCPIRARVDGTKAPLGEWKKYQTDRPELIDLDSWFANWPNLGLVCGQVSERLECLEFEGDFMPRFNEVADRLNRAGLYEEFQTWINGYCETTPRDGLHILVRLEGDGRLPGNTKIAMSTASETWIETRGEGGFVVVAPSNGATHPSGRAWICVAGGFDQIAYTTLDVWDAVLGVLGSFDEAPPAPTPPPPIHRPPPADGGWVNQALDAYPAITDVLAAHGWSFVRADSLGQLWRRPGKSFGHSGRLNLSGRLHVFSSSTPLPVGRTTFDALDVDLAYRLGRAPTRDERVAELRPRSAGIGTPALLTSSPTRADGEEPASTTLCRPDSFWQARPYLAHVYQAALATQVSPDALWENVCCNYLACIPPTFHLPGPPIATLDWISTIVGDASASKSAAHAVSLDLMPADAVGPDDNRILDALVGTGQGIIERYIVRDPKTKRQVMGVYKPRQIGFYTDEGVTLLAQFSQKDDTAASVMRSLWSGMTAGTGNATNELYRRIDARAVRYTHAISITPEAATEFLNRKLADAGYPQRTAWAWAKHPILATDYPIPTDPGPLDIPMHLNFQLGCTLTVDAMVDEAKKLARMASHGDSSTATRSLDGHLHLQTRKRAAVHALMSGRFHISADDWALATQETNTSCNVRDYVSQLGAASSEDRARARGRDAALVDDEKYRYGLNLTVEAVTRLLLSSGGILSKTQAHAATSNYRRRYGLKMGEVIIEGSARRLWKVEGTNLVQ